MGEQVQNCWKIKENFYKFFEKSCILSLNNEFKLDRWTESVCYIVKKDLRIPGTNSAGLEKIFL